MDSILKPDDDIFINKLYLFVFFVIGLLNDLCYSMVFVGSHNIVWVLNKRNLIGVVILSLVSIDCLVLIINMVFLLGVANNKRIAACSTVLCLSMGMMATTVNMGSEFFPMAIAAVAAVGMVSSVGECVNLGLLKEFYSQYLLGFTTGTGSSRIVAASIWLLIRSFSTEDMYIWIGLIAAGALYYLFFRFISGKIKDGALGNRNVELTIFFTNEHSSECVSPETGNAYFSKQQLMILFQKTKYLAAVLGISYFCEAMITVGMADRISIRVELYENDNYFTRNMYEIIQFCYYFGVIIGKSLINLVKFEKLWILIVGQVFNLILLSAECFESFIPYWGEFIIAFWVGILGGLCYSNVFYCLLNTENILKYFKEAAGNLVLIIATFSIVVSSVLIIVIDNYIIRF